MRKTLIPATLTGLVGLVSLGVFGVTGTSVAGDAIDTWAKREEQSPELVLVSDDDEDGEGETGDDEATNSVTGTDSGTLSAAGDATGATNSIETGQTGTGTATNTGGANSTGDHTNSAATAASRDGELSVADLTKDFTADGAGVGNLDLTPNLTNDKSKNDTRGN